MLHHLCLFFLLPKFLFQCIFAVPVRVIVDASEESSQSSPENYKFKYSPVFEQSSKIRKQKPKKTHEERLESFRERYQILKKENPEYLKEKSLKGYIKRRKDPEKVARDKKYRKLYRSSNRAKMNEYQRKFRQRQKEREQQQDGKGKESCTRKRKGMSCENDQKAKKKAYKQKSKTDDITTSPVHESRKPIIARLKVSSETIKKLYGPNQSTHLTPVRTIVDEDYQSESDVLGKNFSQANNEKQPKPKKQKGVRRSYEEKLRVDRERKRQSYLNDPEYHKALNRKTYLKRKSDPIKMAHDAKRRKAYKIEHREEIASRERKYYSMRKAKKEQERIKNEGKIETRNKTEPQKKRKLLTEGNESIMPSSKQQRSSSTKASTEANNTSTRQPIIARLKLSSKTINTFFGKQSSSPS